MRKYLIVLVVSLLMTLPNIILAASIHNSDSKSHLVKGRTINGGWIHVTISSRGTQYFRCRHGCQIEVVKTGSTVVLESDADIVISNGELRIR